MTYVCTHCSYSTSKWVGFCPRCRRRGSVIEVDAEAAGTLVTTPAVLAVDAPAARTPTGIGEVDHVLGGGLVSGAAILVAGEPGVGKSTLLLQVAGSMAGAGPVLMATGEESIGQVGLRARRVGAAVDGVDVAAVREVESVVAAVAAGTYGLVIVDSIQALVAADADGAAGGVTQVRQCAAALIAASKRNGTPVMLVGHVTKDGSIAGPKVIEHMVDVVIHLDGGDSEGLRFLRCLKNRYGTTDRVGIFEMSNGGLLEVADPAGCLVSGWIGESEGTVLFPSVQGRRPLLVEVQALVTKTSAPQPRRSVKGVEPARVHQVLAVLDKHAGMSFKDYEVYVSLAGGVRVREPACDLPMALAIASSRLGAPVGKTAAWGEVGLTGELRSVGREAARTEEATRLGVDRIVSASGSTGTLVGALHEAGLSSRFLDESLRMGMNFAAVR